MSAMVLEPGWLARDVARAAARVAEWRCAKTGAPAPNACSVCRVLILSLEQNQ